MKLLTKADIPTWDSCSKKRDDGDDLNQLESFIFSHEPAVDHTSIWFREELLNTLNEVIEWSVE